MGVTCATGTNPKVMAKHLTTSQKPSACKHFILVIVAAGMTYKNIKTHARMCVRAHTPLPQERLPELYHSFAVQGLRQTNACFLL